MWRPASFPRAAIGTRSPTECTITRTRTANRAPRKAPMVSCSPSASLVRPPPVARPAYALAGGSARHAAVLTILTGYCVGTSSYVGCTHTGYCRPPWMIPPCTHFAHATCRPTRDVQPSGRYEPLLIAARGRVALARGRVGARGAQCARKVRAVCVQHSLWVSPAAMRARQAIPRSAPRICARARLPSWARRTAATLAAVWRPATTHLAAIGTLLSTVYTLTRPRAARTTITLTSRSPSASVRPVAFPTYTSTRAASCVHFAHATGRRNCDGAHVQPSGRYGPLSQRGRGHGARNYRESSVYTWDRYHCCRNMRSVQLRCLYFRGICTKMPSHIVVRSDHWASIRSLLHRSNGMRNHATCSCGALARAPHALRCAQEPSLCLQHSSWSTATEPAQQAFLRSTSSRCARL